jgi:hypothetical protein
MLGVNAIMGLSAAVGMTRWRFGNAARRSVAMETESEREGGRKYSRRVGESEKS